MLNPIEKPSASDLRKARILGVSESTGKRVVRYVIPRPVSPAIPDFVFEVHVPSDGGVATWWQIFDKNPRFTL
jgi:hypothetical protein